MSFEIEYISPIPEDRYEDVIQHLRRNFFADEPINKSVNLCQPGQPHAELEEHSLKTLADNLSIMALEKSQNLIVGVVLNGLHRATDIKESLEKLKLTSDEKFKSIFQLLNRIDEQLDLFDKYNVSTIFECRILSVDDRYRGQGIAETLLRKSLQLAKHSTFKVFKQDATSYFTQRIADKLEFETVYELEYDSYKGDDGIPKFQPPSPHKSLKVMVKLLY